MPDQQDLTGPETITVFKVLKRDGDYVKFDDNQQKKWNCSVADISANLKEALTIDVWWSPYHGTLPDGSSYTSKYIQRAAPSKNPPQDLKQPYQGGGGGGGKGGGGKKDGDFRSRGELIAIEALQAAAQIPCTVSDEGSVRAWRAAVMGTADVFAEYIVEEGKKLQVKPAGEGEQTSAGWGAPAEGSSEAPAAAPAGWGGGEAASGDDDIPF